MFAGITCCLIGSAPLGSLKMRSRTHLCIEEFLFSANAFISAYQNTSYILNYRINDFESFTTNTIFTVNLLSHYQVYSPVRRGLSQQSFFLQKNIFPRFSFLSLNIFVPHNIYHSIVLHFKCLKFSLLQHSYYPGFGSVSNFTVSNEIQMDYIWNDDGMITYWITHFRTKALYKKSLCMPKRGQQ